MTRKFALPPVVTPGTRVLILGSLPGEASLAAGQYYAHPRNRFWDLAGAVIGRDDLPALRYEERLAALGAGGIGLWDAIASAHRPGSLDAAIRNADAAPLQSLAAGLQILRAVAFNGAKSAAIGRRALAGSRLALIDLPSSSPAHAAMSYGEKREKWLVLQEFLREGLQPWPASP